MFESDARKQLLDPFRATPSRAAILTDLDGTLAPIASRPEAASVPGEVSAALDSLAAKFGLVACVTGRRSLEAREMVGVDALVYIGNQGYESLAPGQREPARTPAAGPRSGLAAGFLTRIDMGWLADVGLRVEDKGPIQAIHWRGATDEQAAERAAARIARLAEHAGLLSLWGRKIVELRPVSGIDKGTAVTGLILDYAPLTAAMFIGDDRTDLDAFRALRALADTPRLGAACLIGVASDEGPAEIVEQADLVVAGPAGVHALLQDLVA